VDGLLDGMSWLEFVLRFTISHPALSSTIVGTSNPDHLRANLAIAEKGPLPPDLYEQAKQALICAPSPPGPALAQCRWGRPESCRGYCV
jgi:aryl-alcohol dehydrogenase-like predicted oxidoreductase